MPPPEDMSMEPRNSGRYLAAAVVVALAIFVWAYEDHAQTAAVHRAHRHAEFLEIPLWDLDRRSAVEDMRLLARAGGYRSLTIRHPDGEIFARRDEPDEEGPIEDALRALGLIRDHEIESPIVYGGETIGTLRAVWVNRSVYVHAFALFSLALMGTIGHYYVRLAHSRRQLAYNISELDRQMAERRQLEEQLRQSQKMEAIGQLTAGIAHNFNNMLAVILGSLELSLLDASAESRARLEEGLHATGRAADMVRQLNDITRTPGLEPYVTIDVQSVILDTLKMCRSTFDRRIRISQELPDQELQVLGDAGQLQQVLFNLCLNARDAVDGLERIPQITVSARVEALDATVARSVLEAWEGSFVCIEVTDNGVGIDPAAQEHIFEPFFTTKEVGKGTGLGLSTAYGIAHAHKGWIACTSEVGAGTTLSLYLPAVDDVGVEEPAERHEPAPGGSETILVIDDEPGILSMLDRMLSSDGYRVLTAADGMAGLEVFQQTRERIDLVVLDLSMPHMSGQEVLGHLRSLSRDVKIAYFTGREVSSTDVAEADGIIHKPPRWDDLRQAVRRVLDS